MINDKLLITNHFNPVYKIEHEACRLYREKYPDGIPWLDLHINNREIWLNKAEERRNIDILTPA